MFGRSILFEAARSGNLEQVQWLAEIGADVNAKASGGDRGFTPLYFALQRSEQ